ncbi:dnaJ/Hsp40 cysteine-rich domain superfamily protein [Wolffia australiana]
MAKALGFFVPDAAVSAPRRSAVPRRCALRQTYGIQCSLTPDQTPAKQPALNQHRHHHHHHHHQHKFDGIIPKVSGSSPATKPNSIVCADCDGNGAIQCTQCEGTGVNAVDHFGGRFKAGQLCWLCRGKKEILCGNCNGAGFIGGFMSTFEE